MDKVQLSWTLSIGPRNLSRLATLGVFTLNSFFDVGVDPDIQKVKTLNLLHTRLSVRVKP